ncbi:MAG: hypothetical protein AB9873_06150 [Syntrophobacteraceae bacterium]
MGSIYKALMRATEERQALRRLTGLSEGEKAPPRTAARDANDDLIDLIASIESLPVLPRKKTIQFLGSHDGALATTLARRFAETCAVSIELPVLFVEPERPLGRRDGLLVLDHMAERFATSRRFKSIDDLIRPARAGNLSTCPASGLWRLWNETDDPSSDGSPWTRVKQRFDLIVISGDLIADSVQAREISPWVDAVMLVFESETTDSQPTAGQGDLSLGSILEQIAQGLWCPHQTFSCLDIPLLLLTRPMSFTPQHSATE